MDAQQIFYIIASIALGLLIVFLGFAFLTLYFLKKRVNFIVNFLHFSLNEITTSVRRGSKHMIRAGAIGGVLKTLFGIFKRR